MSHTAHVRSIAAVERFRGALVRFSEESTQALDEVRMELERFVAWLEDEQSAYWRGEVRRGEARVAEAKVDLHRARAATIDPEHTPTCLQEQKALDVAKRRLAFAEEKLTAVKRWIPAIRQAVQDYQSQSAPLVNALLYDVPRGVTFLKQLVSRLDDYVAVSAPGAPLPDSAKSNSTGAEAVHVVATMAEVEGADEPS